MPKPSRLKRWLRRILVAGLIASVALGWAIFQDEPPPDLSDFELPLIDDPEQDNAYWLLLEAARVSPKPPESLDPYGQNKNRPGWEFYLVGTPEERAHRFAEQRGLWTLLDAADAARHSIAPRNTDFTYLFPESRSLGHIWAILLARAIHAAETGDHRAAFADIDLALRLARRLEAAQNDLLPFILSQGLFAESLTALRLVADDCTDQHAITAMIETLDVRRGSTEHILRTFQNQAALGLAILESRESLKRFIQTAPHSRRVAPYWQPDSLMLPLYNAHQTQRIYADYMRDSIALLALPASELERQDHERILAFERQVSGTLLTRARNLQGRLTLLAIVPTLGVTAKLRVKIETQLDLTRLYLALRLYSLRHNTLPGRLDDLAPSCIAELPLDPFSGAPFAYDAAARTLSSAGKQKKPGHTLGGVPPTDPLLLHLRFAEDASPEPVTVTD